MKQKTAILVGAGARGQIYAAYARQHPEQLRIVAVAEPKAERRAVFCHTYGIDDACQYQDWRELLAQPRMADAALIATLDDQHTGPAVQALEKGYHVLLEKPMSNREEECRAIAAAAQKGGRVLSICHVLRYAPFFLTIKRLIDENVLGEVASISLIENVAYWHFAHSFVRGNWRKEENSSPVILAKSCHDMDILVWLMGRRCKSVSSFGSLQYFDAAHAPAGAPLRCSDGCPHSAACPYEARKLYLTGSTEWPVDMLTTDLTPSGIEKALREGPYGRCVYHCDNDVADRQVVNLEFEGGGVASFTLTAFTGDCTRMIRITGTGGDLEGNLEANRLVLHRFGEDAREIEVPLPEETNTYGHAGGDYYLMRDFLQAIDGQAEKNATDAQVSLQSHLICFAAEKSRRENRVISL